MTGVAIAFRVGMISDCTKSPLTWAEEPIIRLSIRKLVTAAKNDTPPVKLLENVYLVLNTRYGHKAYGLC